MPETTALSSAHGGFMEFSPTRNGDNDKENDIAVLSLALFSKAPFVSFGTVRLGTSKSTALRIENPTEDTEIAVAVHKIPSSKGFSVDSDTFTIRPQSSYTLTLTWTPTEEGGIRELIIFNANGVLKHQAVLLGKAEAPQKKKRRLWDVIKNKKRGYEKGSPYGTPLTKMAANKTIRVSRKQQYRVRSPLAPLNDGKTSRVKSSGEKGRLLFADQVNVVHQKHPRLALVTNENEMTGSSGSLAGKLENKELAKILNTTLSPIGTPEQLKKLMPHVELVEHAGPVTVPKGPALCLTDALALINSDLAPINRSPKDSSSSCEFSDSLEFKNEGPDCFKARPSSPDQSESTEPRLTFFVRKEVGAAKAEKHKKLTVRSFNCDTVIKSKAMNYESGRKIKKSRRRLMEQTLELLEGSSQSESGPGSPQLPVIEPDAQTEKPEEIGSQTLQELTSKQTPKLDDAQMPINVHVSSPRTHSGVTPPSHNVPPATFTLSPPLPLGQSSPLHCSNASNHHQPETDLLPWLVSANQSTQNDFFPVHTVTMGRKRKSEHSKGSAKTDNGGKIELVKKSKMVTWRREPGKSMQDSAASRRPSIKSKGSLHSTKTPVRTIKSSVSAQTKPASGKLPLRGAVSLRSSRTERSKMAPVAMSKLVFVKPTQTAIPRHPLPFAAKNMFYDERWIEKQESAFAWWLNYVLTPDDFKVNTETTKVSAMGCSDKFSVLKAPTKEEVSFRTYTARRKLNRLRRAACQLFTSETMVKAIKRLELEVEAKRLLIRKDRHLWKDIGERQKILNWLLSYNPLWLRIGLETIFGEMISLESNSDAMGLAMFILQRLLWNPDIAAEFRHAKVPHLYKDGHEEALSSFTLKKLLLLVCFLDRAKGSRLIEHDPCLFCVDAEFKTSKDLLLAFSRDFLSGEGILPRHLGYLGFPVSHVQTLLDEFDYAVVNLSVDLKCGIRLARVMELLTKDWSLSAKLRLPAISRLQKIHNVDIALQVLKIRGVDLNDEHGSIISCKDIVDGHREKTLSLLWKIIFSFQVELILDEHQLREEIAFLRRSLLSKQRWASARAGRDPATGALKTKAPYDHRSNKIVLLMEWARAVCDFYHLTLENFTVTFSDGRVLCYLIHHYHPSLIAEESVHHSTTQTVDCSSRGRLELNRSALDSDSSFDDALESPHGTGASCPFADFKELLENEKSNFRLVNSAAAFLGGVPAMINPADMSNTIPNEKVVISYVSFLCARLLDLRNETRAARIIQSVWRNYRIKKDWQLYQERNMAAGKIQALVKRFLLRCRAKKQNAASIIIQSAWRGFVTRKKLQMEKEAELLIRRNQAATIIQAQWRKFSVARYYQRLRYNAIVVQAQWRMKRAASAFVKVRRATTVLQRYLRAQIHARNVRKRYLTLKAAVVKIQRGYRLWNIQKTQQENHAAKIIQSAYRKWQMAQRTAAAVKIQSFYRMQRCSRQYRKIQRSVLLIQAHYRGQAQRRDFQRQKLQHSSAIVIQSALRGHRVRKLAEKKKRAAVQIQLWYRASARRDAERQRFVKMRRAARTIQVAYRRKRKRDALKRRHAAATAIQAAFRKFVSQKRYVILRKATVAIQQKRRATLLARKTKREYDTLRKAALNVQAHWKGRADRMRMKKYHQCATIIRAHYRRYKAQVDFRSKKASAVVIQRRYRAYMLRKKTRLAFLQKRAASLTIQAAFRGMKVRRDLKRKHNAATVIQSTLRMYLSRKRYVLLQSAIVTIQCRYRARLHGRAQRHEYKELKNSAVKIQAVYRGWRARREFKKRNKAIRAIQALFRMRRARTAYLATKCAAITIQERYRAKILMDRQRETYRSTKSAAVIIQAAYRGYSARMKIAQMHRWASVIQRRFRTFQERNRFLALKTAVLVLQQRYRAVRAMREARLQFASKRGAAICIQAVFRGHKSRRQLSIKRHAAVKIQSHFRRYRQMTYYKRLRWACSVVQARYQANKEMRRERLALSAKKRAVVVLQAALWAVISRRLVKQKHQAAATIQRTFRAHRQREKYLALKSAALAVQRRYRATVAAKAQMRHYQKMRKSSVIIQAAYRGRWLRKDVARWHRAATLIQSTFRKHREQVQFQTVRLSAVVIQRFYRAHILQKRQRRDYLKIRSSAIILQAAFRGCSVRERIAKMHKAATVIQANFKRHNQQLLFRKQRWAACVLQQRFRAVSQRNVEVQHYREVRKAVICLQAAFRGMESRKAIRQRHRAATLIQSAFRRHREEVQFQTVRLSAVVIQRFYRAHILQKRQRRDYLKIRSSAIILQAAFRGCSVRERIAKMHKAATVIQANFKRHNQQLLFRKQRWAACVLQQRFRAVSQRNVEVQHYREVRKAVICLQAAFRGMESRKAIRQRHRAATLIQSAFRRHREEVQFQTVRLSAVVIQRFYRAHILQKHQRRDYLKIRSSAIILQAAFRGCSVRERIAKMHKAATVIQANFKRHNQQLLFRKQRWAACVLQQRFRAVSQRNVEVQHYREVRKAVICLQAAFRGMESRKAIRQRHRAATLIQSAFRRHREEVQFQTVRLSAVVIQRFYRAHILQKHQRRDYLKIRSSAIILQAAFRGCSVRERIAKMHKAATVIQANFKRHNQQLLFRKQRWAACVLQQRFRAVSQRNVEVQHYREVRKAVICLQAAFRGMESRKAIRQRHRAATLIQSAFRRHREEVQFQTVRLSAVVIQRFYRAHILQKHQRRDYLKIRSSAIILQAAFRGCSVRERIAKMHKAATVIQANFKRHNQQLLFRKQHWAACVLQQRFRAVSQRNVEVQHYREVRKAVICLQAAFRGMESRKAIRQRHRAATLIQSAFRRHREEVQFQTVRLSAVVIQRFYRAHILQKHQRRVYLKIRSSAIILQAAFRGCSVRERIAKMHKAATVIQANFKKHNQQLLFRKQRRAACVLQQRFRAVSQRNVEVQHYREVRKAVICLQAAFRGMESRKAIRQRHQAATVIQSAFRRHREQVQFQAVRLSAVIIQRGYRAHVLQKKERRHFLKVRSSVICLQAVSRGHLERRRIAVMHRAATIIQANFKRHLQQRTLKKQLWAIGVLQQRFRAQRQRSLEVKHYEEVRNAVICLQAAFRGSQSRKSIRRMSQAATTIQTTFRAHCQSKRFKELKSSALTIQQRFRATAAAKSQRRKFLQVRGAAIVLQAAYRGQQSRKRIAQLHQAATVIQLAYRRHVELVKFQLVCASVIIIQKYFRALMQQRQDRHKFLQIKQSAVVLQAAYRGHRIRRDIRRQSRAATLIQSYWRCSVHRRIFQKRREAAMKLQQKVRATLLANVQRKEYLRLRRATIMLQTHYRAWIGLKRELEATRARRRLGFAAAVYHHLSAIKIQRALRAHWVLESAKRQMHSVIVIQNLVRARLQRRRYLAQRRKVVTAQRAVRRWLARRHNSAAVIQRAARKFLLLRRQKRVERGVVKIQALWRGHVSRRLNDNAKVVKLRQCLRKVSAGAREEDQLRNKTASALDCILRYKHFSSLLEALKNLEAATRLSPVCCEHLVESGATGVFFTLIRSCNRSVPCMDVINFSIQILLNLSKYHKTIKNVYLVENSVETLVDLIQRYRGKAGDKVADKGGSIFTKACFLLILLLQDKSHAEEVMRSPKVLDRLGSIYRLTVRKHKLDTERNVTKHKMNASLNGSFYVPATPRKSQPVPRFAPDWVLRKDKLANVVDPLKAIQMLANTLAIVL
ncbi:abnormal spindle-like microcephaly-associated protein [Syngnathus acus]|uniref:abnormal spindle-like microcephaly-associated protein n=1 Tax=Syngnathus acus TaxID=161584 RepID=UPI001886179C|nr:abnormal spindle-like microcephaly-associated protein [Syngnathus acus]